jgi:glycine betaine transporter
MNLGAKTAAVATKTTETALFVVAQHYPLGIVISILAVILLFTFFITSANSATFVLGMFSENGNLNPSDSKKFLWGIIQALLAAALIMAGGLKALQTASIVAAFPFAIVMVAACISITKALAEETSPALTTTNKRM